MTMTYVLLPADAPIQVPPQVALCPYCGDKQLIVEVMECTQDEDGTWRASSITVTCETEPLLEQEGDEDAFDAWLAFHSDMPYVHMLPVEQKILRWLDAHYRFTVEGSHDDP